MARKPRAERAGIYHVFARGVDKQLVFRDDVDRRTYLSILSQVIDRHGWHCLGFCLMENHVHLVIETAEPNLGRGMQRLHGSYASAFNARHGRVGHVFQGRYGANAIESDPQLLATLAYVANNPVEAALCAAPEEWEWSSHRVLCGKAGPAWLDVARCLSFFEGTGTDPRQRYLDFVGAEPGAGTEGTVPVAVRRG